MRFSFSRHLTSACSLCYCPHSKVIRQNSFRLSLRLGVSRPHFLFSYIGHQSSPPQILISLRQYPMNSKTNFDSDSLSFHEAENKYRFWFSAILWSQKQIRISILGHSMKPKTNLIFDPLTLCEAENESRFWSPGTRRGKNELQFGFPGTQWSEIEIHFSFPETQWSEKWIAI